jgi:hypothetical protein
MKSKKPKTVADRLKKHQDILVPYNVWTAFGTNAKIVTFSGDQASFGEDFKDLEQLRVVIGWYVEQLNGKVTWDE